MPTPKLAVLGPSGTYSEAAAKKIDPQAVLQFARSIPEVLDLVANGSCRRGIVPLENSIGGVVRESFDGLFEHRLRIDGEVVLDIHHSLFGLRKPEADITSIYSHPQALAQCRRYLAKQYPQAQLLPVASTVAGLERLLTTDDGTALAIAPSFAAQRYTQLAVIDAEIEDEAGNQTRFVTCSLPEQAGGKLDFTVLAIVPKADRPGLLYDILGVIKDAGINMTQIESRPNHAKLGSYMFYVQLQVSSADPKYAGLEDRLSAKGAQVVRMSL